MTTRLALGSVLALSFAWVLGNACATPEDTEVARATLGPMGGTISGDGFTIEIPAGALRVETELVLSRVGRDLSVGDYAQRGDVLTLEPTDLRLELPAKVSVSSDAEGSSVLVDAHGQTTAHPGNTAYIEYLGAFALADTGTPSLSLVEPQLSGTPTDPAGDFVDNLRFELDLDGTHRVDLVLTAWDYSGAQVILNGDGHCGFKVVHLEGGSLTTGCAGGQLSASINAAGDHLSFDVLPFLAPALSEAVTVGVSVGDGELNYALGYFSFKTGACYLEECSGHGTCESEGTPGCACDEGFAQPPDDSLNCVCVPQCEGKQCASDGCGGSCGDCGEGEMCSFNEGQCVPEDDSTDDGMDDATDDGMDATDDGMDSTDGGMDTDTTDGG